METTGPRWFALPSGSLLVAAAARAQSDIEYVHSGRGAGVVVRCSFRSMFHMFPCFRFVFLCFPQIICNKWCVFYFKGTMEIQEWGYMQIPCSGQKSAGFWNIVIFWWPLQLHALKRLKRSCSRYFYVVILKISVEVCQGCPINLEKSSEATSNSGSSPGKVTNLRTKDARVESQTLEDCFVFEGGWLQFLKLPNLW